MPKNIFYLYTFCQYSLKQKGVLKIFYKIQ